MDIFANDPLRFGRGPGDVARDLRLVVGDPASAKAEGGWIDVAGLYLKTGPVDSAAVQTRRRAGLQAAATQPKLLEGFAEEDGGWLSRASGGILLLTAV